MDSDDDELMTSFLAQGDKGEPEEPELEHQHKSLLSRVWTSGTFCISLSAVICSTIPLSIKQLHGSVHAIEVTFLSSVISWTVTSLWLLGSGEELQSLLAHRLNLLVLRGMLGAVSNIMYYTSIQMLPMQEAVTLFFTNPAMAVMLEWLMHNKHISKGTIAGCACSIIGVYLISHPTCNYGGNGLGAVGMDNTRLLGVIFALIAALATAGGYVCVHAIGPDVPLQVLMWWYHSIVAIASAVSFAHGVPVVLPTLHQTGWVLAVAGAHFTGQLLLNRGQCMDDASHGSALFAQQVLYSYVWHVTVLHGDVQLCAVLGSAAILGGVLFVTESSSMDHALRTLESERSRSQLLRQLSSGRLGFVDRLRTSQRRTLSLPHMLEGPESSSTAAQAQPSPDVLQLSHPLHSCCVAVHRLGGLAGSLSDGV